MIWVIIGVVLVLLAAFFITYIIRVIWDVELPEELEHMGWPHYGPDDGPIGPEEREDKPDEPDDATPWPTQTI